MSQGVIRTLCGALALHDDVDVLSVLLDGLPIRFLLMCNCLQLSTASWNRWETVHVLRWSSMVVLNWYGGFYLLISAHLGQIERLQVHADQEVNEKVRNVLSFFDRDGEQ